MEIRLIDANTDLSGIKPLSWDVVVRDTPYYVAHVPGYVHTLRGWGEPIDLWCWPRNERPSYDNLIEYELDSPVAWGMEYVEKRYVRTKWDETSLCNGAGTTITRNGEAFYFVSGRKDYSIPKALTLIARIQEHPLDFFEIDYDKRMIGRKIWYRSQPAIIQRYVHGQCCIIIVPDGAERFTRPPEYKGDTLFDEWDESPELKVDCLKDAWIDWFRE